MLIGGDGNDTLRAGNGVDRAVGGEEESGYDDIYGGPDYDICRTGEIIGACEA